MSKYNMVVKKRGYGMMGFDIEKAVFDLVETYNRPSLFCEERPVLKHKTDWICPLYQDAYDLLVKYTEKFMG